MSQVHPMSRFEVEQPGKASRIALWMLSVVLPVSLCATAVGIAIATADPTQLHAIPGGPRMGIGLAVLMVLVVTVPFAAWLHRALARNSIELERDVLNLRAAWYRQRIPVADLDLDAARVLSLDEHRELRPLVKTNAIALPGFRAGHFRLRDFRRKAFCLLTSNQRVLALPEREGRMLLLSLRQPQRLLDALRARRG